MALLTLVFAQPSLTSQSAGAFRADGLLDMRMSKSGQSAADIVMHSDEADLAYFLGIWRRKAARRIAKAICQERAEVNITSTSQLVAIIHVMPARRPGQIDPQPEVFRLRHFC